MRVDTVSVESAGASLLNQMPDTSSNLSLYKPSDPSESDYLMHTAYLEARARFVDAKGWTVPGRVVGGDDRDSIDSNPSTYGLLIQKTFCTDAQGALNNPYVELVAGARITHFSKIEESLSWNMLGKSRQDLLLGNLDRAGAIDELRVSASNGLFFDITRLVPGFNVSKPEIAMASLRLFGAAYAVTKSVAAETNADIGSARWLFCVESDFLEFLTKITLAPQVVYSGPFSETDNTTSHLCFARPSDYHDAILKTRSPEVIDSRKPKHGFGRLSVFATSEIEKGIDEASLQLLLPNQDAAA